MRGAKQKRYPPELPKLDDKDFVLLAGLLEGGGEGFIHGSAIRQARPNPLHHKLR